MFHVALLGMLACAFAPLAGEARDDERLPPGLVLPAPQAPDRGWGVTGVKPREVGRIYWDLLQTTEVLVRVVPLGSDGKPVRVNLVFQAFFPGRETRDWNAGLPQWPRGPPARLTLTAQAFPLTFVIPRLSLQLVIDGAVIDLTAPGRRYRNIPCLITTDDCTPNGVEADLEPSILASLIAARSVQGHALEFPFELTRADLEALAEFASRIGLTRH
jgi:hypothetical protein